MDGTQNPHRAAFPALSEQGLLVCAGGEGRGIRRRAGVLFINNSDGRTWKKG